jgi:hypothetical protein
MAFRMAHTALGFHSIALAAAASLFAMPAGADEPGATTPPAHAAVGVSLDGSAIARAPAPTETPAADEGSSKSPSSEDKGDKNPANYEFAFVSVGAYQAWSLAGRVLYFGAGGGVGPPLYRYAKLGDNDAGWYPNLDIVYGNVFLRIAPVQYVDIDVGPKIAIGATLYDVPPVSTAPESAFSYGGYADLRVGSRTVKLGPRFEYMRIAHSNYYEKGWILTPLMLRVVH